MASLGDWAGIATVASVAIGAVLTAYWGRKRGNAVEQPLVTFNDGDRRLLGQIREALGCLAVDPNDRRLLFDLRDVGGSQRDALLTAARRIDQNTDAMNELRRAIEDNTRARRE